MSNNNTNVVFDKLFMSFGRARSLYVHMFSVRHSHHCTEYVTNIITIKQFYFIYLIEIKLFYYYYYYYYIRYVKIDILILILFASLPSCRGDIVVTLDLPLLLLTTTKESQQRYYKGKHAEFRRNILTAGDEISKLI